MHTLFDFSQDNQPGELNSPELTRLLEQQLKTLGSYQQYYHRSATFVRSGHPLVKLLYSFNFGADTRPEVVYSKANDIRLDLAIGCGITTPANFTAPHDGVFYPGCQDYLISMNAFRRLDVDGVTAENWQHLKPVRVLYHPYILPAHFLPDGGDGGDQYSIIGVDIPMLAVMFIHWAKENAKRAPGERQSPEQFIGRYVLANCLVDQFNLTLFNQLYHYMTNRHYPIKEQPFRSYVDYSEAIFDALFLHAMRLQGRGLMPLEFLHQIPSVQGDTLADHLPRITTADTIVNYPIRVMAWLPHIEGVGYWIVQGGELSRLRNKMRGVIRRMRNRMVLDKIDHAVIRERLKGQFEQVANLYTEA